MDFVDVKFFQLIGLDCRNYNEKLRQIMRECNITDLKEDKNDRLASETVLGQAMEKCFAGLAKDGYRQAMLCLIKYLDNYQKDFDIARFMLIGSCCSGYRKVLEENRDLPFSIAKKKEGEQTSVWCMAYRDIFKHQELSAIFSYKDDSFEKYINGIPLDKEGNAFWRRRIEKYSYQSLLKIKERLEKKITEKKSRLEELEKTEKFLDNGEKKEKEALECASDGHIEDYLVADMTLGISLTALIYFYLRDASYGQLEQCKSIIFSLAGLKCYFLRNKMAEVVFSYIVGNNFSTDAIENVMGDINDIVGTVNSAYTDILCIKWYLCQLLIKEFGEEQVWKDIVKENGFGILGDPFGLFEKEILRDMKEELGIIPPLLDMKAGDFAEGPGLMRKVISCISRGLSDDAIRECNKEKMGKKQEIRGGEKSGKKSVMYAKIHEIVVMRGVIDRNGKSKRKVGYDK